MAVATWNRNESKLKFLYTAYEIERLAFQFIANAPKKYQNNVGNIIIRECDNMLYNARIAQNIFPILDPEMLLQRRYHIIKAKSSVDTVCVHITLWFDLLIDSDGLSENQKEKLVKRLERIGKMCVTEIDVLDGLMASDIERWNKSHPHHKFNTIHKKKSDVILGEIGQALDWVDPIQ